MTAQLEYFVVEIHLWCFREQFNKSLLTDVSTNSLNGVLFHNCISTLPPGA